MVLRSERDPHREVCYINLVSIIFELYVSGHFHHQVKILAESNEALDYARRRLTVLIGRKVTVTVIY